MVRLIESGEAVEPNILAYLNRLSDLLWLFARKIEVDAGSHQFLAGDEREERTEVVPGVVVVRVWLAGAGRCDPRAGRSRRNPRESYPPFPA